jgi:TolB-like protein/tetratricopeptide (TPR) repeat protein
MGEPAAIGFLKELRRRRVFRVAGLYVIGIWVLMQAANILFPAWGIPDAAIRFLLWAGLLGFPLALAFGWVFDVTTDGIRRTQPVSSAAELQHSLPLRRADYLILAAFLVVMGALVYDTSGRVMETATTTSVDGLGEWRRSAEEIEPNSVAVLPFASLSSDPEHEYFANGISEEILNRLAAFRELKVIARTSSFAFKDSGYDAARIGGLLAVKYLLQGSVRRDGQQLRISAQLIDQSGVQVWQKSFDRELGGIFQLQDEIAEAVASSIVPQIVPPSASERREPDLSAYLEYMAGREIIARRPADWGRLSSVHLSRAIEIDPEFAEPYAARAVGSILDSWMDAPELRHERAQRDIETALELNPDLGLAHAAQALLMFRQNSGTRAEREAIYRRALQLDPNLVEAWNWLSNELPLAEGLEALRRGARIDPLSSVININLAARDASEGRYADAERRLIRLLEIPRPSPAVFFFLCALQNQAGRIADALECGKRRILELAPIESRPYDTWMLSMPYGMLGMVDEAEYWLARHMQEWPEMYQMHFLRAFVLGPATGHLPMPEAIEEFKTALESFGMGEERLGPYDAASYGMMFALMGDHERAIPLLERHVDPEGPIEFLPLYIWGARNEAQALAWAWQQTGQDEKAARLLDGMDRKYRAARAEGRQHTSEPLFEYARNALLLGHREQALELLGQAAEAGWRGYYGIQADPRWDSVREEPKFQAVLASVKADLDAQRARVEAIEAEDDFIARYDAAMAEQAGRARQVPP